MKQVNTQNFWSFELGTQERINVPIGVIIGFQQRDRQDSQNLNKDRFCRPPVICAQWIFRAEKHTDACIFLKYDDDEYSQCFGQIREVFRALTKNDVLNPKKSDPDVRSTNVNVAGEGSIDISYNFYLFDFRYQKNLEAVQPFIVEMYIF